MKSRARGTSHKKPRGEFFHLSPSLSPYHGPMNFADLLQTAFAAFVGAYRILGLKVGRSAPT